MRIERLFLYCQNIPGLADFYLRESGFPGELNGNTLQVKTRDTILSFIESENPRPYHFAFNIPENRIREALHWLKQRADIIPDPNTGEDIVDFANWNAHSIYFPDPFGNVVEFIARHNLKNPSEKTFGASSILNVSEIGIPVSSVKTAFESITAQTDIDQYSGNLSTFCAAGDEEGLLIITHSDRNWFPTTVKSEPAPFRAEILVHDQKHVLNFDGGEIQFG